MNEPLSPVYHTKVAETCKKCHYDPKLMAGRTYNGKPLACDEYAKWSKSVHGVALLDKGDLSAPACNNCHGNHGAAPPQVGSVANACGTCHGKIAKLFSETKMRHAFEKEKLPGCATCHSNHEIVEPKDDFLGMQEGSFCVRCHEAGRSSTAPRSPAGRPSRPSMTISSTSTAGSIRPTKLSPGPKRWGWRSANRNSISARRRRPHQRPDHDP